jgi:hypothetical protein
MNVARQITNFWDITPCSLLKLTDVTDEHITSTRGMLATCFHTGFLHGLFFNSEDGGNIFLQNVS